LNRRPTLVPSPPWEGRRVVLAVTGGIACYKSVTLARDLSRLGAEVDVLMTRSAEAFVRPLAFEAVTGRPVLTSLWSAEGSARHIRVAREADVVVVAPATADLMARAACGRADDLVALVLLATRAPVLMAPAMNDRMWSHPQTRRNAEHLRGTLGHVLLGPAEGPLAAGEGEGPGRMVEPGFLVEHVGRALGSASPWEGVSVLVTAGPTREAVDAVRYVGNRSTGRMGYALAREAWLRGAQVTLVTGPTALAPPEGSADESPPDRRIDVVRVESAVEMRDAVLSRAGTHRVQVFAAAVSDFRPAEPVEGKRKRARDQGSDGPERWAVELIENPDVAGESLGIGPDGVLRVGFALETDDPLENAATKLRAKGFDWVVVNPAGEPDAGFESETNRGWILGWEDPDRPEEVERMSKDGFARRILDRVETRLGSA
jgi:phosphopantothenoylcysteine decarboxylase / phosphopantothenate---cysteine ligase